MSASSSSTNPSWQRLWQDAQPQLESLRSALSTQPSPAPRIIRVGQLDTELLDQELVQLLQEPLTKALQLVNSAFKTRFEPEVTLFIQLILYKFSVWNAGASYGAKLQGLKYSVPNAQGRTIAASGMPRRTLLMHGAITMLIPYIHTRIRAHALSNAWPDAPSSDRRRKAWELLTRLESTHSLLGLANFVAFLWNGRYRTLADRLLGMRLVSARRLAKRDVSYEFMNRQMVWHAFTEFLLFLLPIINVRALRRRLARITDRMTLASLLPTSLRPSLGLSPESKPGDTGRTSKGKYWSLPLDQCAICYEDASTNLNLADPSNALTSLRMPTYSMGGADPPEQTDVPDDEPTPHPIHIPYITSCGHTYCYVCITGRMIRTADELSGVGPGGTLWECLRCAQGVSSAERVEIEVEEPESDFGSGSGFEYESEDMDFTDMSGSMGSYSTMYTESDTSG